MPIRTVTPIIRSDELILGSNEIELLDDELELGVELEHVAKIEAGGLHSL